MPEKKAPRSNVPNRDRWENEGGQLQQVPLVDDRQREMERYGIVAIPQTIYELGGYRYTNFRDALDAAKWAEKKKARAAS